MRKIAPHLVTLTAIIGCILGVISLAWQIHSYYQETSERLFIERTLFQTGDERPTYYAWIRITNASQFSSYIKNIKRIKTKAPRTANAI